MADGSLRREGLAVRSRLKGTVQTKGRALRRGQRGAFPVVGRGEVPGEESFTGVRGDDLARGGVTDVLVLGPRPPLDQAANRSASTGSWQPS